MSIFLAESFNLTHVHDPLLRAVNGHRTPSVTSICLSGGPRDWFGADGHRQLPNETLNTLGVL